MAAQDKPQACREHKFEFFPQDSLTPEQQTHARTIFSQFISHCEPRQSAQPYKKVTLVRLTYEHVEAKDKFLRYFFTHLDSEFDENDSPTFANGVSRFLDFGSSPPSKRSEVEGVMNSFAEFLFDNFYLPLRATGNRTPQTTPADLSARLEDVVDTPARLSVLRRDCLIRDHHRCVVNRVFDLDEAGKRYERYGSDGQDDDGERLDPDPGKFARLEVAHIIPHSMMSATRETRSELTQAQECALAILDMFVPGVIPLIDGSNLDRPHNAITLSSKLHVDSKVLGLYFEALDPLTHPPHTYRVDSRELSPYRRPVGLPVTRTLLVSPDQTIDLPSPKLLAIHRAVSIILHLSAAGGYLHEIMRDMKQLWANNDGSSPIGHIVSLKLGGWFKGVKA